MSETDAFYECLRKWDSCRAEQVEKFERLIRECRLINHSSGVVERLQRIQAIADELDRFSGGEVSFTGFIRELARHGLNEKGEA